MHEARRAHDLAAEDFDDGLVAEADAKHWNVAGEGADHGIDTPACAGRPRPGEMHRCVGSSSCACSIVMASLR